MSGSRNHKTTHSPQTPGKASAAGNGGNLKAVDTQPAQAELDAGSLSLGFLEELYQQYLAAPESLAPEWRTYFDSVKPHRQTSAITAPPSPDNRSIFNPGASASRVDFHLPPAPSGAPTIREVANLQDRVDQMIRAYRVRGHLAAQLDPLGSRRPDQAELDPRSYGFTEEDLDRPFSSHTIVGPDVLTLRQILERLRNTYCRSIGVQFMHIDSYTEKKWLQDRMEGTENRLELSTEAQFRILTLLTDAVIFEEFIQRKFIGSKSFSLEGGESLIPLLYLAIEKSGKQDVNEIVIGMGHRGRLNVLANIMNKTAREIFREFEDKNVVQLGGGDVKYHLGYHRDWTTSSGKDVHLALCFNPSHLEYVNPVALGRTRAKQDRLRDESRDKYSVILIHGDAAFAGEGIVQETLNLGQLGAYTVGGTIHVIVNNQIGFTTNPEQGRSGEYATDVAKMLQSPIFHVNGEDPEAVAQVIDMAIDYRNIFKRDVVIDMFCYRRRGHNEGDEPSFTQPLLYKTISNRKSVRDGYLEHLLKLGQVTPEQADEIAEKRREELEAELMAVRSERSDEHRPTPSILGRVWRHYSGGPDAGTPEVETGVEIERLTALLHAQARVPSRFTPHPKIVRLLEARQEMADLKRPLDWAAAEALAFASIATDGYRVRLTGQDSERGTFSHRHATLHDYENGDRYSPLQHLTADQAPVEIYNSPLSEAGVLGFEYGYSIAYPDALVAWEAQFGDFWNVAQVIVDQFIASAEDKWGSLSGLTMLLPHGFEGMGPEHSSARLERFLLMAAEDNIQVVYPSTPAQLFHVLRRQVVRPWRKPLVVMTPKSLLRHPAVVSDLEECAEGRFQRIIPDQLPERPCDAAHVILCTGKVYYELEADRESHSCGGCAIVRVEQLYPLSTDEVMAALEPYPEGMPVIWVQEEPENMGAWRYFKHRFGDAIGKRHPFTGVCRPESASPATGSSNVHKLELEGLLRNAIGKLCLQCGRRSCQGAAKGGVSAVSKEK